MKALVVYLCQCFEIMHSMNIRTMVHCDEYRGDKQGRQDQRLIFSKAHE